MDIVREREGEKTRGQRERGREREGEREGEREEQVMVRSTSYAGYPVVTGPADMKVGPDTCLSYVPMLCVCVWCLVWASVCLSVCLRETFFVLLSV